MLTQEQEATLHQYAHFFPKVSSRLKTDYYDVFPFFTQDLTSTYKPVINRHLENVSIQVRQSSLALSDNCWCIPFVASEKFEMRTMFSLPGILYYVSKAASFVSETKYLENVTVTPTKIRFNAPPSVVFNVYTTPNILAYLTEKEFISLILNEMGYWRNISYPYINIIKKITQQCQPFSSIGILIALICVKRESLSNYRYDSVVGLTKEYEEVKRKLSIKPMKDLDWFVTNTDIILKYLEKLNATIDKTLSANNASYISLLEYPHLTEQELQKISRPVLPITRVIDMFLNEVLNRELIY